MRHILPAVILEVSMRVCAGAQSNFWQQTDGPYQAETFSIASNSGCNIFLSTDKGVYRSTDDGNNWVQLNLLHTNAPVNAALAVHPNDDVFALADTILFQSTDNGDSWRRIQSFSFANSGTIVFDSSGNMFVGKQGDGVYRSTDDGKTWADVSFNAVLGNFVTALGAGPGGQVVAGLHNAPWARSTDGGVTWAMLPIQVTGGCSTCDFGSVQSVLVLANGIILAGTVGPQYDGEIIRSTDDGASWNVVFGAEAENGGVFSVTADRGGGIFAIGYWSSDHGSKQVRGVYRSTDTGATWSHVADLLPRCIVTSPAGFVFVGTTRTARLDGPGWDFGTYQGGVYRWYAHSQVWTKCNVGLASTHVTALLLTRSGTVLAGTKREGIFEWTDKSTWEERSLRFDAAPNFRYLTCKYLASDAQGNVFVGTGDPTGSIYMSSDEGRSWQLCLGGTTSVTAIVAASNGDVLAATDNGMFKSSNHGSFGSWHICGLASDSVTTLAVDSTGILFAGTLHHGMYRSSTGGDSWEAAGDGIVDVQVHCIAVNRASHVFIGTSGGVFRSTDNGNTWQAAGAGIAVGAVIQALAVNAAGQIYAGTTGSVYVSNDNGSSWNPVLPGITNSDARALAFDNNGYLFAATWGGGVFVSSASTLASPGRVTLLMPAEGAIIRRDTVVFSWHAIDVSVSGYELQLAQDSTFADSSMYASSDTNFTLSSLRFGTYWWRVRALNIYGVGQFSEAREFHLTTTTAASLSDVPEIFRLDQNYPNPFNPETSIRFEVPYRSRVRLQIFNTLGQLVTTLADEVRDAGRYEARWNALNVASGVYLCRMEAGSFVDTRKLLLVR